MTFISQPKDFSLEVAKGNVAGHSHISKFGENSDIDIASGFETIWDGGATYVPPTVARIHDVVSTVAADVGTTVDSGTATGGSLTTLIDTGATFISSGVAVGDIVLNDTNCELGVVTTVTSETTLTMAGSMRNPDDGRNGQANESGDSYRVITDASTGASIFYVKGLNTNRLTTNEFVILNGTSNVATSNSYLRQFRARVFTTASDGAAGNITSTAQTDGTVSCQTIVDNNQTLMSVYTIPFDKTGYIISWWGSLSKKQTASVVVRLRAGILDGVGYTLQTRAMNSTGSSEFHYKYNTPLAITGGADLWVEADTDTNDTGVSSGFELLLVDN